MAKAKAKKKVDPKHPAQTVRLADLKPHPRNYREHPDDQLAHLIHSIETNGFYRNVVVARDNTILAGHGVVKAAAKMGIEEVPVVRIDVAPNDPRALKVLAGDNEQGKLAIVDDRALTEILRDIGTIDPDGLLGTGFDEQMLAGLVFVTRPADEIADFNEAAEWVGMPEYEVEGVQSKKLVVHFTSNEDRERFVKEHGIELTHGGDVSAWDAWWPEPRKVKRYGVEFVEKEKKEEG